MKIKFITERRDVIEFSTLDDFTDGDPLNVPSMYTESTEQGIQLEGASLQEADDFFLHYFASHWSAESFRGVWIKLPDGGAIRTSVKEFYQRLQLKSGQTEHGPIASKRKA